MTVEAVIWDLGGVLVRTTDPAWRERWERRLGLGPGGLSQLVFEGARGWDAQLGRTTVDQVWKSVGEQFNLSERDLRQLKRDFWRGDELNTPLLEFIRDHRERVRMGLLSNAWRSTRKYLEQESKIAGLFEAIIISAEHGITKPDPEIYRLAVRSLGVEAPQAVFVDDLEGNVVGARSAGLQAIHFRGTEQTLIELRSLLGEAPA